MIAIIDYNMGNLASVSNALNVLNAPAKIVKKPDEIKNFDKLILPGVGAFKDAMEHLKEFGFVDAIKEFATQRKPLLGICLGMQLLFESSEEFGYTEGLGLICGKVVPFDVQNPKTKVPHMGWNLLKKKSDSPLLCGLKDEVYLYFVHSFHALCDEQYIIGKTLYDYEFASAVQNENIFGFQPHPEKSHENGLKILKNFVEL